MPPEAKAELDEARKELAAMIRGLKILGNWIGIGILAVLASIGFTLNMVMKDHFEQTNMKEDVDYMRPRVDRLWYRTFPDSAFYTPPKPTAEIIVQ